MFDPTAFDNMKVVLEGALYDLDIIGEISIIDRNDFVNLAKLSRSYEITFTQGRNQSIPCLIRLEAGLANLAAELHPSNLDEKLAGAHLSVFFTTQHVNKEAVYNKIEEDLKKIWGDKRSFTQKVSFDPLNHSEKITNEITINFNRLIFEDQMDDLTSMVDYMITTMEKLSDISQ